MDSFPLDGFDGYKSKTLKCTKHGDIKLDVVYPEVQSTSPTPVLLHYHGGFLIVGDRYSFLPYWLVHACVVRKWIFVSPDYRLIPETTAQSSLEDAVDAYNWVMSSLGREIDRNIGPILLAGSSAGGYLAMATAATVQSQPCALLLIYGTLDPTYERHTTPGSNIFGGPLIDTETILARFPRTDAEDHRPQLSAYPLPSDVGKDQRFPLISALHIEGLFSDYMTGIGGLSRAIVAQGNDSAVPVEVSFRASDQLRKDGVEVHVELPEDAEHGFDARAGNVNVESPAGESVIAFQSLRNVISFLDRALDSKA
ncbi:uncharacterized protein Z518_11204 [Rhinocladiella mackenziei CBS 650.93]|uniref:Alpha/beta hydrolase fold-3 domain-containing protein n=1 Tax=Rhinocladiella mackenziei CBS 650.93 TaxID=1442369 RepID=A0A0D2I8A6_9EURO|nr:uncharacterized protein Z518_11204 [Rhinocladiella mackenziei CBS 650.93]KIW99465.1 hypothetical protein Z518_11204 [Rhinocladiella mackenziei CBS 650.93]